MFEIKKEEKINKTFRIPKSLLNQLEAIAQNEGISVNNLVIQCCEYAMEDFEDKDKYVAEQKETISFD